MKKIRISKVSLCETLIEIYGEDDMRVDWYEETSRQEDWEDFQNSKEYNEQKELADNYYESHMRLMRLIDRLKDEEKNERSQKNV